MSNFNPISGPKWDSPDIPGPPIYRAFLLSPKEHGKSGDYCMIIFQHKYFLEDINIKNF